MLTVGYRYLKCLMITLWVVRVSAPREEYYEASLRDTPIIREIKNYHAQYKNRLRNFFNNIHEIISLPALTLDDKALDNKQPEQEAISKTKAHYFAHQFRYVAVQLESSFVEDALTLHLLEMFNVVNKRGTLAKEFLAFCYKLRDKEYFKFNEELSELLVDIELDIEEELSLNNAFATEELLKKIKQVVIIRETAILEVVSNLASQIQEKKRVLAKNEVSLKLLDHISRKFLAFANNVYQLLLLHSKWIKKSVINFVRYDDDEPLESDLVNKLLGLSTIILGFDASKTAVYNKYCEGLAVIFPTHDRPPAVLKAQIGTHAAIRELFDFCGIKPPFQHYSNFAEEVFRLDEHFGLSSDLT